MAGAPAEPAQLTPFWMGRRAPNQRNPKGWAKGTTPTKH